MHEVLGKFTKGRDNLNIFLCSYRGTYSKVSLGYQPKSNAKSFSKFSHANKTNIHT